MDYSLADRSEKIAVRSTVEKHKIKALLSGAGRHSVLMFWAFICLFPFLWLVLSSFKSSSEIIQYPPTFLPASPTFDSYIEIFTKYGFGQSFFNSIVVTMISTGLVLYTASSAGFVFAKYRFFGRDQLFIVLLSTLMIPFSAVLIPLFLQFSSLGWIDTYQALVIPTIYTTFGIFIMRQFIQGIPYELIEAARIDGASEMWVYVHIILPLSTSSLAVLGVLHFFAIWDSFLWPLSVVNSPQMRTLPLAIAGLAFERGARYDLQITASVVANIPVLIIYLFAQRYLVRGIALTGTKL
jgi:multiple sugar transport system permease protein